MAICFLFAFSPFLRRAPAGIWSAGRRIGTPLPSAVTTTISPSSFFAGAGRDTRNSPTVWAIFWFIRSRLSTGRFSLRMR